MDHFQKTQFATSEAMLEYFRGHADDIDRVEISISKGMLFGDSKGERTWVPKAAAQIRFRDGTGRIIPRDVAEMLINDGFLQQNKIPCLLRPTQIPSDL